MLVIGGDGTVKSLDYERTSHNLLSEEQTVAAMDTDAPELLKRANLDVPTVEEQAALPWYLRITCYILMVYLSLVATLVSRTFGTILH